MKYVIITTYKNEAAFIEKTILSVLNQTAKPEKWILINDNSTDYSSEIVNKYAAKYDFIHSINNTTIDIKEKGARIATIINQAVNSLNFNTIDLILKLDADVIFEEDYIYNIIQEFVANQKLGIASGTLIYKGIKEKVIFPEYTRGATKFYRTECWKSINGLYPSTGWDTIDNESAMIEGWKSRTLDYSFHHLKEEGKSQGIFKKYFDAGLYYGKIPYYWPYLVIKSFYRIAQKPFLISSFITLLGYLKMRYIIRSRPFPNEISVSIIESQKKRIKKIVAQLYVWNLWHNKN